MNKSLASKTYYLSGFGLNARCGHNQNVTWTQRYPVWFGQPVYDLTCECGATAVKRVYAHEARKVR